MCGGDAIERKNEPLSPTRIDYQKRIFRAMNHINRDIERELSLEEIADSAAFSPFHFHRIFKAVVGENVAEFTRRLRIELASNRLLSHPARDVTSIALSCGFSSSQNFAKAFRQRYAMTPTEYRSAKAGQKGADDVVPTVRPDLDLHVDVDVSIREMPRATAATIRRIGAYGETCPAAFSELLAWAAGAFVPGPGGLLALYWDNPEVTPALKCRFDCCLLVPEDAAPRGSVFMQSIGGGLWAFCRFETAPTGIPAAWDASFRWLIESGYECRPLPCCEIYYNDFREHPEGKWIIDIAIPLDDRR